MSEVNEPEENYRAGYISIYRSIRKHWIWENPDYLKAWICILLECNYTEKKILIGSSLLECKRGQSLNSLQTWAKLFGKGWTVQRTRTFMDLLKNDSMINTEGLQKTTRLTVCNYDSYQDRQHTNNTPITGQQHASNKLVTTNNNINNNNKENNISIYPVPEEPIYRKFNHLKITVKEYESVLAMGYLPGEVNDMLDQIQNYKKNKNYTSLYLTLKNWLKREKEKSSAKKEKGSLTDHYLNVGNQLGFNNTVDHE